uniref:Death domain-containing protein n=1 Tax=Caenorhabditis tropicalis TaxID=1561998 RepID=A0A1I7TN41_9PELO
MATQISSWFEQMDKKGVEECWNSSKLCTKSQLADMWGRLGLVVDGVDLDNFHKKITVSLAEGLIRMSQTKIGWRKMSSMSSDPNSIFFVS